MMRWKLDPLRPIPSPTHTPRVHRGKQINTELLEGGGTPHILATEACMLFFPFSHWTASVLRMEAMFLK